MIYIFGFFDIYMGSYEDDVMFFFEIFDGRYLEFFDIFEWFMIYYVVIDYKYCFVVWWF